MSIIEIWKSIFHDCMNGLYTELHTKEFWQIGFASMLPVLGLFWLNYSMDQTDKKSLERMKLMNQE